MNTKRKYTVMMPEQYPIYKAGAYRCSFDIREDGKVLITVDISESEGLLYFSTKMFNNVAEMIEQCSVLNRRVLIEKAGHYI